MRTTVFLFVLIAICLAFGSSTMAWTYKYECDNYANLEDWVIITGFIADMEVLTDPDDPTNNLLHITSADGGDVDADDYASFEAVLFGPSPYMGMRVMWMSRSSSA